MRLKEWIRCLTWRESPANVEVETNTHKEVKTKMNDTIQSLFDDYEASFDDHDEDVEGNWSRVPANSLVINTRSIADGASNLSELADMLRIYADYLDGLAEDGYLLHENILQGSGYAYLPEDDGV